MSLRYSRRIKICKGVHLNISKSGVGISLGGRGASISSGPKGTYINTGIPGTGISFRQKVGAASNQNYNTSNLVERDYQPGSTFQFQIDNEGKETFLLLDPLGKPFTNEPFVRRIKRTPEYKEIVEKTRKVKNDFVKKQNDEIVFIYKSTPKIITKSDVEKERDDTSCVKQKFYSVQPFEKPQPIKTSFYDESLAFAKLRVKTHKFWKKKELIREATYKRMDELYKNAIDEWLIRQAAHFSKEKQIKQEKDAEYKKEYEREIAERNKAYELILNPTDDYLQDTVRDVLSQIELPVDFSIDYAVSGKNIELDIDLPEIEDFPQITSSILQSGKLSIKKKSVTDLNKDYATSVVGMSFFFAGLLFNISPAIENISIAGYTQRISKQTGNIEDQYVYSVKYTRDKFAELNVANISPLEAIENFEHTIDISPKFELRTIDAKQSENRKSTSESQEVQTKYYRVENEKKELEKKVIVTQLDSSSSSIIQQKDEAYNQQVEAEKRQREIVEENKKFGKGCLIFMIIIFCLMTPMCVSICSSSSDSSSYPHQPYRGK